MGIVSGSSDSKAKAPAPQNTVGDLSGVGPGTILHMVLKPSRKHAWVPLNAKKAADAAAAVAEEEDESTDDFGAEVIVVFEVYGYYMVDAEHS